MSRTYRYPVWLKGKPHRHPRTHRARKLKSRDKDSLPTSYDDVPYNEECWMPFKVARKLQKQGLSREEIISSLMSKFNLSYADAAACIKE